MESKQKIHFIAIGGSVMHQLAISLKYSGFIVSGSDDEIFDPAKSNAWGGSLPSFSSRSLRVSVLDLYPSLIGDVDLRCSI